MKIGIFGGSFDPVHRGHIELAERALLCGAADSVVFVPAAIQPFKQDKHPADGNDRINMIKLAAQGIKGIEVSDYELASLRIFRGERCSSGRSLCNSRESKGIYN